MDSKKLEIFVTTVDMGSFTKASEVVGYTQSGLTHMMNSLEREIGFSLISRGKNGVTLTEQGALLMPAIREFLRANSNLENQIRTLADQKQSIIRIAAYSSITMHWMPEILYRFRRLRPDVHVELRMVDNTLEPFELLGDGQVDVIFASRQNYSFCHWTPLYKEKMYAILPKDFPLSNTAVFSLTSFEGQEFLMPYGKFDLEVKAAMAPLNIKPNIRNAKVDDETLIRLVGRGLGVTMMAELMIRGKVDDVQCVPIEPPVIRQLGMGTYYNSQNNDAIQQLTKCVLEFISEYQNRHSTV